MQDQVGWSKVLRYQIITHLEQTLFSLLIFDEADFVIISGMRK